MSYGTPLLDSKEEHVVTFAGLGLKLDTVEDVGFIVSELKGNTEVTCLNLTGNTLGIVAAEPLGAALENNKKLRRCIFSDLFTGRLKTEIAPALRHLCSGIISSGAQLVELDLSDNAFGPNGVVGVVELLSSPACFTLEVLRMNNQGLGHEGCRYLTQALEKGREACNRHGLALKVFSASRNRLENVGAQMLAKVLADMGSLEELSLCQNGIGIHGKDGMQSLSKILMANTKLRLLNLSDNTLTAEGGKIIAKALRSLDKLEELHLGDCILRSSGAQALAAVLDDPKVAPDLRVLNLSGNEITRQAGVSLVLSLGSKSHLESLDLNANEFGKSGIQAIIRSLESIDLLHTLSKAQGVASGTPEKERVGDEAYVAAFDEDQGSASESEEEAGEEQEEEGEADELEDSNEAFLGSEEEGYDYENGESDGEDEAHSSFNTVKEQPLSKTATGFSFRDLHNSLNESNVCSANKEKSSPQSKTGPFGGGLFSSLPPADSTDASVVRSKAWPSTGLFASAVSHNGLFKPSHLFSPPSFQPPANVDNQSQTKLMEFETQLQKCLTGKHDEAAIRRLAEIIKSDNVSNASVYSLKIPTHVKSVLPERVIRLGLQLSLHLPNPLPEQPDLLTYVASNLLASMLSPADSAGRGDDATVLRAVNCLLVYLGAIKAERDSEEHTVLNSGDIDDERRRMCYFYVTRHMFTIKAPLSVHVRNCLSCLLSEQKSRQHQQPAPKESTGKYESTVATRESDRLRDELIGLLELQLADLRL
ncbi:Ran GTPase-activating protein 1 [Clonorchis sinensis]|uniref:Ran GTPase-activating protein 1 n=1 Tax=Clonorchis sinensis TaxID=79923 RepID=A0A8T1MGT4_CLOSI|nr:Ran GTPase-activating protein 1 [Clonorchis sinensis]